MRFARVLWLCLSFTTFALSACSGSSDAGQDAGLDATAPHDGSTVDTGHPTDAGTDGGVVVDAWAPSDTATDVGTDAAVVCANPATDCPATTTTCVVAICSTGHCATMNASIGTACTDAGGTVCDGSGACVPSPNGTACAAPSECASGHCADGRCCDVACTGQCENCSATPGTCSQTVGAPVGSRTACDGAGTSCGGACSASRTQCDYPTTQCRAPSCSGSTETAAADCDGAGACPAVATRSCGPYVCFGTSCQTSCSSDLDCISGDHCNGGQCNALLPIGSACSAASQCSMGNCVDGYCCNSACTGQCQACDVANNLGLCTTVMSGAPHASHTPCTTDAHTSACNGTCNGNPAACTYPTASCPYAGNLCGSGVFSAPGFVNGGTCSSGSCTGGTVTCCSPYTYRFNVATGTYSCYTSCSSDAQCFSSFFHCMGGACL